MGFIRIYDGIPSGKRLHNYGKIHHAINGKIHYFDWAIFNSYVSLPEGIAQNLKAMLKKAGKTPNIVTIWLWLTGLAMENHHHAINRYTIYFYGPSIPWLC